MAIKEQEKSIKAALLLQIVPLLIFNLIVFIIIPDFQSAGFVYLGMGLFAIFMYSLRRFKEEVTGLKMLGFSGLFVAALVTGGFILFNKLSPNLVIGLPNLNFSLVQSVRLGIIVVVAPVMETYLQAGLIALFRDFYGVSGGVANFIQAPIMAFIHLLAYGVYLGALDNLQQLFGAVGAIAGLLFTALIVFYVFGLMLIKLKNVLPVQIAHGFINFYLITLGFVVVSFGSGVVG